MNLRNLERVLAREEEVKKRAIVHKAVYTGPQVRYISKEGMSYSNLNRGFFTSSVGLSNDTFIPQACHFWSLRKELHLSLKFL